MKRLAVALLLGAAITPALAADAADPERLAEARAVLNAIQVGRQLDAMTGTMAETMSKQFAQGRPQLNQRTMQVMIEESMRSTREEITRPGGLMDAMATAYASQFTFAELRQIREFYESPVGQRMLSAGPEIMKQLFPRMMEMNRTAMPRMCARAKERLVAEKIENAESLNCPAP